MAIFAATPSLAALKSTPSWETLFSTSTYVYLLLSLSPPSPAHRFLLLVLILNSLNCLQAGAGFGEYAILATTNKIRSCAAIAIDDDSMLLVMHADTYNAVLRQHHYRQKQLSSATSLLSELPLFRHNIYSKIASIAYTMRSQTYSSQSVLVRMGDPINNVLLIASGQVKVYSPPNPAQLSGSSSNQSEEQSIDKSVLKRLPRLAVAILGRGQIIGEVEIQKGERFFLMTYETASASTEILEMPATVYKEALNNGNFRRSPLYKSIETVVEEKEQRRAGRVNRAYDAMVKMVEGRSKALKAKEEIISALPILLEPSLTAGAATAAVAASARESRLSSAGAGPELNGSKLGTAPPTSARKTSILRSPRKLSFSERAVH